MFCPNCGKENDDAIRHCQNCGSFIPDPSIFGDAEPSRSEPKPLTYQALSQEPFDMMQQDTSRYQEYTMSDVVVRKSRKKWLVGLIVTVTVLALAAAVFFAVRGIISAVTLGKIKDDPTKYVLGSYQTAALHTADKSAALHALTAPQTKQKTTKVTTTVNGMQQTQLIAIDGDTKQAYCYMAMEYPEAERKSLKAMEAYAALDRLVLRTTIEDQSQDCYLNLNNLRQDAAASLFGPKGQNLFHISQENYDMAMDVYEFVYNNLKKEEDPFSMVGLGEKLCQDFENCAQIDVTEEKADIDGVSAEAVVVTHTFRNTDILTTLFNDVRDWIKNTVNINQNVNRMIDDALAKVDINRLVSQLNNSGQIEGTELSFKHYVNKKDNALMQAEIILRKDKQGMKLTLCFGAEPTDSRKVSLKVGMTDQNGSEITVQTITLQDESTDSEEKQTAVYSGFLMNGTTAFVRNRATGAFTLTNDTKTADFGRLNLSGVMDMTAAAAAGPSSLQFSLNGHIEITEDTVTLTCQQPLGNGAEASMVYVFSTRAEIKELTSENDLLTMTEDELKPLMQNLIGGTMPF